MSTAGLEPAEVVPAKKGLFHPTTFTLDNGMQVVVVENHRAPVVAHWVWYKVGCADSPVGKSGLPHFLEHLMFKGTDKIPPGAFSKEVARQGGNDNAQTSLDYTAYFQLIAKDRLPLMMEMEADRMANLRLVDEIVYPERDVIVEERRQRTDNDPAAQLSEQMGALQYLHHPYRLPVIGWMHEIQSYTREDALAFYERWYAPGNAVLVVAGDITAEELRPLAEATYGKVAPRGIPERVRLGEPPQLAERRLELADERVGQPMLIRSYLVPSFASEGREHAYALEVLMEWLGSGGTSELFRELVVEKGLASNAGGFYRGVSLDPTLLRLYAIPRPGVGLDTVEEELDEVLARVMRDGIPQDALERVQKRMLAEAVYDRDSLMGASRYFGACLCSGLTVEEAEEWPDRIASVGRDEILAAAALAFDKRKAVTGRLVHAA
ncbi:M16 family metallopeptidase, partial [Geminicoccus roseus]|uniref:M16 family metallopeptidase n=1 Tax=Geminicoccus roseus TaxID=404900 RepID=UPI0005551387